MDFGIRGIDPEPRAGYRLASARARHLQEFSDACWQRHEAHHTGHPGPLQAWPGREAFHANWPRLATDLIVADWRFAGAAAGMLAETEYLDLDLLDPPPAPVLDWHDTYGCELAGAPAIAADLAPRPEASPGDGIERVLERANLTPAERRVMRAWLYTPDLALIAEDLGERAHTVATLHRNALHRLRWLGSRATNGRDPRQSAMRPMMVAVPA